MAFLSTSRRPGPALCSIFVFLTLLLVTAAAGTAQYMFLDCNGDGRTSSADQIPRLRWTQVDIWLDTGVNRDGSRSSLAAGATTVGVAAYSVLLQGGVFDWGSYTPADSSMKVLREKSSDSTLYFVEVRCDRPLGPGKHRLGRLVVRPKWGAGSLNITPCALSGSDTLRTCFKAFADGPELKLGPTVAFDPSPIVVPGEWHDATGVSFGMIPLPSAGPVRSEGGFLYLGWNRIEPPYELRIVEGRTVINGLALPEDRQQRTPPQEVPIEVSASFYADVFAGSVRAVYLRLGYADSIAAEAMATAFRQSGTVDSLVVGPRSMVVYPSCFRSLRVRSYIVSMGCCRSDLHPWPQPEKLMADQLGELDRSLRSGYLVQIEDDGTTMTVPEPAASDMDRSIQALQRGRVLSAADSVTVMRSVPTRHWDSIRHPIRLERIRP